MRFPRSCGTLLHPTSLPSRYGIGDFGRGAFDFIDFLNQTNQKIWQVLPLNPVSHGNSPYTGFSAFAGNRFLINPDDLVDRGLLKQKEADSAILPETTSVDFETVYRVKEPLLRTASDRFFGDMDTENRSAFETFRQENRYWLSDYALFMACSSACDHLHWNRWDRDLARRKPEAMKKARSSFRKEIDYHTWCQFEFFRQWQVLHDYAKNSGIRIIGDIPIFVDHNSADVWSHSQFFEVDTNGNRTLVAGVPPDYFSETGQLWGNPLYDWKALEQDGYSWWIERFKQMFFLFDAIRIDHFRGFDASWEVSAGETTAINGRWAKGPGSSFFKTVLSELGELPLIAEDLGVITPEVSRLRDEFGFPGMRVLQFAFDSDWTNSFLPHNYTRNSVVYSGTHDNDTSCGWYEKSLPEKRHKFRIYTNSDGSEPNWGLIRLGVLSVADQAIFPLQDFMNPGSGSRMNIPGTAEGNWGWRFTGGMLGKIDKSRIISLLDLGNRS